MSNVVQLIIEGVNNASGVLGSVVGSFTELNSALMIGQQVMGQLDQVYDATISKSVEYGLQVEKLSMISGTSTEETSRFIQVLKTYGITADDALTATRKLTAQGYAPTIESIGELSDKYLSINNVEDRNALILKDLGRSGLAWVEVLSKGSQSLREQGDAVDKSLLWSLKMVDQAKENEVATANWNRSVETLSISIGNVLMPALTDSINATMDQGRATEILQEKYGRQVGFSQAQVVAARAQASAEREATDALKLNSQAVSDNADSLAAQKAALDAVTSANTGQFNVITSASTENQKYYKSLDDLTRKHDEQRLALVQLQKQGWSPLSQKVQDAQLAYQATGDSIVQLGKDHEATMKKMVFDLYVAKLQTDGFTDAEMQAALKAGESAGLIDDATVQMVGGWEKSTQAAADSVAAIDEVRDAAIKAAGTYTVYIDVSGGANAKQSMHAHAQGGSFVIPPGYENEGFMMPGGNTASSGETVTVSPNGRGGGNTINFNFPNYVGSQQDLSRIIQEAVRKMQLEGRV